LLKKESNRPAYIAYQRETYQKLDAGIQQLIQQNETLLEKLNEKEQTNVYIQNNKQWRKLRIGLKEKNLKKITPEFKSAFENKLSIIGQQTSLLVDITGEIKEELSEVKGISKDFSKQLRENWFQKNKVLVGALLVGAFLIIGILYLKIVNTPFNINLRVGVDPDINVHSEYPKLSEEARIRFFLPTETKEKEITFSNEIILNNLPKVIEGKSCKVVLLDRYWQLSKDSLSIEKGSVELLVRPNDALSAISGRVLSRNGKELLSGVKISAGSNEGLSNKQGLFSIALPIADRRIQHILRVEKEGYEQIEIEYVSGSDIEIRLNKNE
jgi:hypothetical protein